MKIATSDLLDANLDWAVLEALKPELKSPGRCRIDSFGPLFGKTYKYPSWGLRKYTPSTDWKEGGLIIEREKIEFTRCHGFWRARMEYTNDDSMRSQFSEEEGETHLIAAMRCFVASRLGDVVDIPEELR